jgi:hypothetical protein
MDGRDIIAGMRNSKRTLAALIAVASLAVAGCTRESSNARASRDVSGFDTVRFSTSGHLIITQGDHDGLEIEAPAAELPRLVTEVSG